jgi:tetratricopeptide (TPR) repeat protein
MFRKVVRSKEATPPSVELPPTPSFRSTKRDATDSEWLQWIEVQKSATQTWLLSEDLETAITTLDQFLAFACSMDLQRDAIAFRGSLRKEQGDLEKAKSDFSTALAIAEEYGLETSSLEISLAGIFRLEGALLEAEEWSLRALRTAAADPKIAAGGVLLRFLRLRGEKGLSEDERQLVEKVVRQSWHLLRVEGEPALENLQGTAQKLIEAQGRPSSAEHPPSPKAF